MLKLKNFLKVIDQVPRDRGKHPLNFPEQRVERKFTKAFKGRRKSKVGQR